MVLLGKFLRLPTADKILLLRCLLTLLVLRIGLSLFSLRRVRAWLPKPVAVTAPHEGVERRIAWGVNAAARAVPGASCLVKAFAAQLLLANAGQGSQMRIGVGRDDKGKFIAHAWLVSGGRVVVGGPSADLERYTPLADLS
jgi:hypothetical protein